MKFVRQVVKKIRVLQHERHGVLGVTDKDHRSFSAQGFNASGEGLVGHVVFHDIDQRPVHPLAFPSELVKGHGQITYLL